MARNTSSRPAEPPPDRATNRLGVLDFDVQVMRDDGPIGTPDRLLGAIRSELLEVIDTTISKAAEARADVRIDQISLDLGHFADPVDWEAVRTRLARDLTSALSPHLGLPRTVARPERDASAAEQNAPVQEPSTQGQDHTLAGMFEALPDAEATIPLATLKAISMQFAQSPARFAFALAALTNDQRRRLVTGALRLAQDSPASAVLAALISASEKTASEEKIVGDTPADSSFRTVSDAQALSPQARTAVAQRIAQAIVALRSGAVASAPVQARADKSSDKGQNARPNEVWSDNEKATKAGAKMGVNPAIDPALEALAQRLAAGLTQSTTSGSLNELENVDAAPALAEAAGSATEITDEPNDRNNANRILNQLLKLEISPEESAASAATLRAALTAAPSRTAELLAPLRRPQLVRLLFRLIPTDGPLSDTIGALAKAPGTATETLRSLAHDLLSSRGVDIDAAVDHGRRAAHPVSDAPPSRTDREAFAEFLSALGVTKSLIEGFLSQDGDTQDLPQAAPAPADQATEPPVQQESQTAQNDPHTQERPIDADQRSAKKDGETSNQSPDADADGRANGQADAPTIKETDRTKDESASTGNEATHAVAINSDDVAQGPVEGLLGRAFDLTASESPGLRDALELLWRISEGIRTTSVISDASAAQPDALNTPLPDRAAFWSIAFGHALTTAGAGELTRPLAAAMTALWPDQTERRAALRQMIARLGYADGQATPALRHQTRAILTQILAAEDSVAAKTDLNPYARPPRDASDVKGTEVGGPVETPVETLTTVRDRDQIIDLDTAYATTCAGLVLVHPFLSLLFSRLEVRSGAKGLAPDDLPRALAILGAIADLQTSLQPADPLERLLLGLPDSAGPIRRALLDDSDLATINGLLTSIIGRWSRLGQTSPDGLRATFIRRAGTLRDRAEAGPLLTVEKGPFDILLDGLPWAISPIALPWMPQPLAVEWRDTQ